MATIPQPPRPPVPPPPPRSGSNILAIVLLSLALIVVVASMAVWYGVKFLARGVQVQVSDAGKERKEVSIKTPVGGIDVNKSALTEAALGLPIYPGSSQVGDASGDSASVRLGLPGNEVVRLVVGKFQTPDPIDKVKSFYQARIGSEVTKFREKDEHGKTVFEIRHDDKEHKIVALQDTGDGTRIELVHVLGGSEETN